MSKSTLNIYDTTQVRCGYQGGDRPPMRLYTADMDPVCGWNRLRGAAVFVLCGGPSLADAPLDMLCDRGILTMGLNQTWCVFRPSMWLCTDDPARFSDVGWMDPAIEKFVPAAMAKRMLRTRAADGSLVDREERAMDAPNVRFYVRDGGFDHKSWGDPRAEAGVVWGEDQHRECSLGIRGKRSCLQAAISMLWYLGAGRVYIVGADFRMDPKKPYAFNEQRDARLAQKNNEMFDAMNKRFHAILPKLGPMRIYNCTPDSGLTAFPKMPLVQAVSQESLADISLDAAGWYYDRRPKDGETVRLSEVRRCV